jgi:hypothetical protein
MWLFTKHSYLSVTEHKEDKSLLHIRARIEGDIERYFPDVVIEHTPLADYQYRTNVPRERVARVMADIVRQINYPSYKKSIHDKARLPYINDIWEMTVDMGRAITHNLPGGGR